MVPKWKFWVLVEKIGPPTPPAIKKSPCTFDRVFSCLTAEEEGDKVGNNIVCSFLALGKIILKEGQEKTCQIGVQNFTWGKFTNKLPLISEDVNDICIVICPKQNLAKLNLRSSQNGWHNLGTQGSEESSMHKRIKHDNEG